MRTCLFSIHSISSVDGVGRVGSGKSTLLASILGETTCVFGNISVPSHVLKGGFGHVPQEPWIIVCFRKLPSLENVAAVFY